MSEKQRSILNLLIPASLFYLCIPYTIFYAGFLRRPFALLALGFLALGLGLAIIKPDGAEQDRMEIPAPGWGPAPVALFLLTALAFLIFSGVGGYGHQDYDWLKHNALLWDLIRNPWPPGYTVEGGEVALVYNVAYYLPAALIGKAAGWYWANQFLFVWTCVGLVLAMTWFAVLARRIFFPALLVFAAFSGLDVAGEIVRIASHQPSPFIPENWWHIEWWAGNWQYSSNASLLFWVPQHAVAGWILTGMIFHSLALAGSRRNVVFHLSLAALWSPFIFLGLLPYVVYDFLADRKKLAGKLGEYVSVSNFCGLVMSAVAAGYYGARIGDIPLKLEPLPKGIIFLNPVTEAGWTVLLGFFILFLALEFGIYVLMIKVSGVRLETGEKRFFAATAVFLACLPLFRYGFYNDLVMRASIPPLFVLAILVARALFGGARRRWVVPLLVSVLLLGSITSVVEFRRHLVMTFSENRTLYKVPGRGRLDRIPPGRNASFFLQYVGSREAPFFKLAARRPAGGRDGHQIFKKD